jgi:hypothetical protein
MKFRNYCIVIIGDTKAVYPEIDKVSEGKPNILDGKGMIISTFTSFMEPSELTDYFTYNNRNFLLFDLNKDNSGFFITKKSIHDALFSFLDEMDEETLKSKSEEFLNVLKNDTVTTANTETVVSKCTITERDIKKMTKTEKDELFNKIIDCGIENLTDYDKKILNLLVK